MKDKNIFRIIGKSVLDGLRSIGAVIYFGVNGLFHSLVPPFYLRTLITQIIEIGFYSLPVVGMTAIFTGAVLALQSYTGFSRFSAESSIATVVVLSITRELGPVLAGLMVAGRVGASMAAEIGTMKVTEQLDALVTLCTNPIKYILAPRIIACMIMLPCLVLIADIIGIYGGFLVSTSKLGFNPVIYLKKTFEFLEYGDVMSGIKKSAVFGFIIATASCFCGFNSSGGAAGVGKATTNAVVLSSILILLSNYLLTQLFFIQ